MNRAKSTPHRRSGPLCPQGAVRESMQHREQLRLFADEVRSYGVIAQGLQR